MFLFNYIGNEQTIPKNEDKSKNEDNLESKNQDKKVKRRNPSSRIVNPAIHLRKHSPIKMGLKVADEDKPLEKYNKILPRIYLGNIEAASDQVFFKKYNIKAVLNCTKEIPHYFIKNDDIEYMRIPVDDSLKETDFKKMYEFIPCIVEFIHKQAVLQKQNILIHCHAGRQRSAISVAVYLVAKLNMTPSDACKYIMDKRKEAFHFGLSLNFEDSLNKYYKDLQKNKRK
jgi:protein-tyrosine phosphatase